MKLLFAVLVTLISITLGVKGQSTIDKTWKFNEAPAFWFYADEYRSAELNRVFNNGAMHMDGSTTNANWSFCSAKIDSRKDVLITMNVTFKNLNGLNGASIMLMGGGTHYFFKAAPNGTYWVGCFKGTTKTWETRNPVTPEGQYDVPTTALNAVGKMNVFAVAINNNKCSFSINKQTLVQFDFAESFPELATEIADVGFSRHGPVDLMIHDFTVKATDNIVGVVSGGFTNVNKTFMEGLNAAQLDRWSVLSPNGKNYYFIRSDTIVSDDIITAEAATDSTWSAPTRLGKPLNNRAANNVISVAQDGNELFLWGQYTTQGEWSGSGFSVSHRTTDGWSVPTNITITDYENTATTREECAAPDRSVVLLSAQRKGGRGNKDLWVTFRQPDGTYSKTTNLGSEINTEGEEGMPFLAADNRTLYFASNTGGYGSSDIYVSKRLDDTWTRWSTRVNMGPEINTSAWDAYFTIHPSGKYGYLNTSDGKKTGIYRITLRRNSANKQLLPEPVVVVSGNVLNAKTKKPIEAEIRYADIRTGQALGVARSEPAKGNYSIVLLGGRGYEFYAHADGFFPVSENLIIDTLGVYQEIKRDLLLEPIESGAVIRLNNLFFDYDKADLRQESEQELNRVVQLLTQFPNMTVEVSGHTDDRGADAYNEELSASRAQSVASYISRKGIVSTRLTATGYGKTKPLTKDKSDAGRQKNRRVEFKIVKM